MLLASDHQTRVLASFFSYSLFCSSVGTYYSSCLTNYSSLLNRNFNTDHRTSYLRSQILINANLVMVATTYCHAIVHCDSKGTVYLTVTVRLHVKVGIWC